MGALAEITHNEFPDQGLHYGKRVEVCFHCDTRFTVMGEVVRDDAGEPYQTIIKLDDGRYILATECQYRPAD